MDLNGIFLERYTVQEEIGSGSFGKVFKLQHNTKPKSFALKIDIRHKGSVFLEAKVLSDLQGAEGIPKLYKYGSNQQYSYMIIELLDKTLGELIKICGGKFTLATVASIMLQVIQRIESIHKKGYLHRDIKPHQILTGIKNKKRIYITDYGLANKFEVNNYHISYQTSCQRVGNPTFSSLNNHSGIRQSRRDDLESLAFLAIYLIKGRLP